MSPQQRKDTFDLWMKRVNTYGWPAVIIVVMALWVRPHADGLINDMRDTMKRSAVTMEKQEITQARQAEISAAMKANMERIDTKIESTHGLVRDIHAQLRPLAVGAAEPQPSPDECEQ